MTLVIGDITISIDGFVTGPGADPEHGLGRDADGLHAWALESDDPVDRGVLERHPQPPARWSWDGEPSTPSTGHGAPSGVGADRMAGRRSSW